MNTGGTTLAEPNDFFNCFATCNGYSGFPFASNHLNLVNAKGAWDITRGLGCVKIAILDVNFTYNNDLVNQIDGVVNTSIASTGTYPSYPWAHGTEVAGMAAAQTNNSIGISSLGYNVKLRYYPAYDFDMFLRADLDGCKVINCSWSHQTSTTLITPNLNEQLILDKVYADGVTVVAGAGNMNFGSSTSFFYPASYNHVISVTSVGSGREVGSSIQNNWNDCHRRFINPSDPFYSNTHQHNSQVDICAPGYFVETTGDYNYPSYTGGTSLGSPLVAAAAALLYSLNPNLTASEIEYYLINGAADISGVNDNYLWAGQLGGASGNGGRLDAATSLKMAVRDGKGCQPEFTDIIWKHSVGSVLVNLANNYDCYDYNSIYFSLPTTPNSGATVEWEFILNGVSIIKYGTSPSLSWGEYPSGTLIHNNRVPDYCVNIFEVYVRQYNSNCCYSAYYKEDAYNEACISMKPILVSNDLLTYYNNEKLKLYPSPAKSSINVVINNKKSVTTNYQIFSIDGKSIKQGKISGNNAVLNIGDLQKGIYLFKTTEGSVKFIKE